MPKGLLVLVLLLVIATASAQQLLPFTSTALPGGHMLNSLPMILSKGETPAAKACVKQRPMPSSNSRSQVSSQAVLMGFTSPSTSTNTASTNPSLPSPLSMGARPSISPFPPTPTSVLV